MFWSKNKRTVAISAGNNAPHLAHNGKSINGTSQGRPHVVANCVGIVSAGRRASAPWARRAERAMRDPRTTPIVGAKLEILLRIVFVKYTVLRSPLSNVAVPNVVEATARVRRAFVNVDAGDKKVPPTSLTASTTKIVEIKTEKISSVKRVRYFTRFDADVMEDANRIPDVHKPVHA
mmetsp:Transcript_6123/g.7119  ORF Transcript_6123/g.7119 Transcript_6123/m.7119 type:complete len:177 (+) Transcript_6123:776-1306(+)